jgi:mono/diheme cytochrome c family protein
VRKWFAMLGLGLGIGLALQGMLAASRTQLPPPSGPTEDLVQRGREAFTISCAFCHGTDARGGEDGPDLVRSEMMLNDEGGGLLGPFLQVGRPDLGMPAFQMSGNQVSELAAFVRAETDAVINRGQYEIQNVLTGDADRGRAYFNGEGGCSGCHSPTGDLAGIANSFEPPDLLMRFIYPGRGGRGSQPQPRTVRVVPPDGPVREGLLEYIDDFSVALRTSAGVYYSFSREDAEVAVTDPYAAHIALLGRYTDDDLHDLVTYLVTLD